MDFRVHQSHFLIAEMRRDFEHFIEFFFLGHIIKIRIPVTTVLSTQHTSSQYPRAISITSFELSITSTQSNF